MKALHPECGGAGCHKCDGGYVEATLAAGTLYTCRCVDKKCGFENGGRIVGPDLPPLPKESGDCVLCGSGTVFVKLCEIEEQ